jgi:hypothetical protein
VEATFKDGGYYQIDVNSKLSLLGMNTLMYNNKQFVPEIGPEAENQFKWLTDNLTDDHKQVVIFEHIYAEARGKQATGEKFEELWFSTWNKRYFDLLEANKDNLMIEIAGHDHWEDMRLFVDSQGKPFRNLLIGTGIGTNHFQLPGFNTLKFDTEKGVARDLVEISLDITETYGLDNLPPLDQITKYVVDYAKDYGIKDLSAASMATAI